MLKLIYQLTLSDLQLRSRLPSMLHKLKHLYLKHPHLKQKLKLKVLKLEHP